MPWQEASQMMLREEFVGLAERVGCKISELCRRFGVSRKTGYKWINRFRKTHQIEILKDRSRRPNNSPRKTNEAIEKQIIAIRQGHPAWGGRKIRRLLQRDGVNQGPAPSTITEILRRNGLIAKEESAKHKAFIRFERNEANDLWQMDFKGHIPNREGRCHPLTALDDYSRYAIVLEACRDERAQTVRTALLAAFRRYGLPRQMIFDNGPPWGDSFLCGPVTRLTIWLMKLGIEISHSRPLHPQTMGKDERFHRTLKAELLGNHIPYDFKESQKIFDKWRYAYNHERPHEALNLEVPATRFSISPRVFPEEEPVYEYGPDDLIRKVQAGGWISYKGTNFRISKALRGEYVAIRFHPEQDGIFDIFFIKKRLLRINLRNGKIAYDE
jgi:transposase InsO family protein